MRVPLLDLKAQYQTIRAEIDAAVAEIFESQAFVLGAAVEDCEEAIAGFTGARFACGMSSGTDALLAALMALDVGPGDEVITSPYTFFASAGSIARLGARPVFVDIDPVSFNLDPAQLEARIGERTCAIMPVHLYGRMADVATIGAIADRAGIPVVEDAAQAIGAARGSVRAGTAGRIGCFSFFPSKNLGGAGDGGMAVTSDPDVHRRLRELRVHGSLVKYRHRVVGGNFRLDALQAAVVRVKLAHLDDWTAARRTNGVRYAELFRAAGLADEPVDLPEIPGPSSDPPELHVVNQYVIRVPRRDALREFLASEGVASEVYYPIPLHLQECFADLGHREGEFPESEKASRETLALPIYPELSDEQAQCVVDKVGAFFAGN